jgi:hypothetical protein
MADDDDGGDGGDDDDGSSSADELEMLTRVQVAELTTERSSEKEP